MSRARPLVTDLTLNLESLMKLLVKASLLFFLVILLTFIAFGGVEEGSTSHHRPTRARRTQGTDENLVSKYVRAVRNCLRLKTRIGVIQQTREALEKLWRILPTASDQCSVNAQLSLRFYPTPEVYNIFFIQNMNTTLADSSCTIVSLENARNAAAEKRLLEDNSNCHLLAIDDVQAHNETERIRHLPLTALIDVHRTDGSQHDDDDLIVRIGRHVGDVIDLLVIGSEHDSADFASLLLLETDMVTICQVNLIYREPKNSEISRFTDTIHSLTDDERYVLMRADRDRQSLYMQLFFINHRDQYCLDRYLRKYTYD